MISFGVTAEESRVISAIVDRAERMAEGLPYQTDRTSRLMDIMACHANGCPLDLHALLEADDFNFAHDVFGITRHIDRQTGQLGDCFLPRFAKPDRIVSHGVEQAEAEAAGEREV